MTPATEIDSSAAHMLDRAGWNSLTGPHSYLAEVNGLARRYPVDISPFNAVADESDPQAWADLRELIGDEGIGIVVAKKFEVPAGWEIVEKFPGVQMTGDDVVGVSDPELVALTIDDAPEMLELIATRCQECESVGR